ncbi:hypothetical protein ACFY2R_25650 [Micromonospora olivasterospora]|uniref:Uncharacterized protein n=1 Tax=Micromonospora olivasterospora TaxID=1880 RepID=A0A562I2F6_MICOL|nr:hypothetical protein [Micromonospora olivasterospora]TWH65180.1 hypothetical protein JD77_00115 [Micromonospora olivasterospora]
MVDESYFSITATTLDGRVLRSRSVRGIEQEVYALLTAYQALICTAGDATSTQPGLDMDRLSCTILIGAAVDTITDSGILPDGPADLLGTIGKPR